MYNIYTFYVWFLYDKDVYIIHEGDIMDKTKSYNLTIPVDTYNNLQQIAAEEVTTVADLLRRATKLLLYIRSIVKDPDARLLVERKGEIQEIVLDLLI